MTNQSDIRWPNSHTHDCVCAECMQARGKCNQSDKQGVREKIAIRGLIATDWETALEQADAIIDLIERDVIGSDESFDNIEDMRLSIRESRNMLRAEQRARLKGKHE